MVVGRVDGVEEWQPVSMRGVWLADRTILIDNRVHGGRPGYHVMTPLRLDDGEVVLVRRGWVAVGPDRSVITSYSIHYTKLYDLRIHPAARARDAPHQTLAFCPLSVPPTMLNVSGG